MYLDLLKNCLTRYAFDAASRRYRELAPSTGLKKALHRVARRALATKNLMLVRPIPFDAAKRSEGCEWPPPNDCETMIGLKGLDNLQYCVTDVLRRGVPGDLLEAGVWRGGAAIFMRAILKAYGDSSRVVWAADSFCGLPQPDARRYPHDAGDRMWTVAELKADLEEVKSNFVRYGLFDDQVKFLVGWFRDTLPVAPIERLAVLRLDGDMYESTMDGLTHLYPKLSAGGYVIIDDYGGVPACKAAVDEYRARNNIREEMQPVNWECVFWKKRA